MRFDISLIFLAVAGLSAALPSPEALDTEINLLEARNITLSDAALHSLGTRKTRASASAQGWSSTKCQSKHLIKKWEERPIGTLPGKKAICYYPHDKKKARSFKVTGAGCSTILYENFSCNGPELFISNSKCTNFKYGSVLFVCPIGDVLTL